VAVNQEIMRNVGVHTLILQALRLPFNGRRTAHSDSPAARRVGATGRTRGTRSR
jgi:hypothetical protein